MYLRQELLHVTNGRQTEAINRLAWIHSLMKPQPGFVSAWVSRYLGTTVDLMVNRRFDSQAALVQFRTGTEEGRTYTNNRPPGLYEQPPVGKEWDLVADSPGAARGIFLTRTIFRVADGRAGEFTAGRRRHDELALQVPGVVSLQTFRCTDDDAEHGGTFLCLGRRTSRDAHGFFLESPQAAEYRRARPEGLYQVVLAECYEIADEVLP